MIEVSVLVLTYNHGKYIEQCLDSIVCQKTTFTYEIIILDDASNDETVSILKKYKRKYQQISLYLRLENSMYPTKNMYFLQSKAKGKYFAWCEGDDYWIDEYKIQKQYDFMESNNNFAACFCGTRIVNEIGQPVEDCRIKWNKKIDNIYSLEDFSNLLNPGMTAAFFSRNYFNESDYSIIYKANRFMGDITIFMLSLIHGEFYQMDDIMASYRFVEKVGGNSFNSIQLENKYKEYNIFMFWCKLEKYVQEYVGIKFYFKTIPLNFYNIADKIPSRAFIYFLYNNNNKLKYLLLLILRKYFNGNFIRDIDIQNNLLDYNHRNWLKFKREKKPLVIFGAGTIAAEYLDKYAWRDNILFITDNNKDTYEKSFKGYMIKNPKELQKYKDKIVVLITNHKYENEISKQLKEIGITNYYGYNSMVSKRLVNKLAKYIIQSLVYKN